MSWFTKVSLRNRSLIGLAIVAVVLFGIYGVTALKQELIPDLTFPYLTVIAVDQGASPDDMERNVTTPLEQAIKTSSDIKEYDSFSNEGMSVITIQYEFGADMKAKQAEVQEAVSRVQQQLPATATAPKVAALNINSIPVVQLAVSSSLPPQELAGLLGARVVPRLQAIEGVQSVDLSGVQQMQLYIQLKPQQMAALGVLPAQITAAIADANLTTGVGTLTSGSIVYPITVAAKAQTVRALQGLALAPGTIASAGAGPASTSTTGPSTSAAASGSASSASAKPVRLGDIADMRIAPAPLTAATRTNGRSSVGISVSKSSSGNTVDIANAVADTLPAISRDLNGQAKVFTVIDQSVFVKDSIGSLWREGLLGAIFAVGVIWVFLRSWRSTLIAGLSIPLSIIGALIILWSGGESLNMLTLGGLTIAIGRVIDDSIVVIENIHRHLQEGDSIRRAAYTGTREVAGAVTASTLTTVAVFLPLGFMSGLASEFFRPFALTVSFALLSSLAVALMVVPVASTWVLSKRQVGHRDAKELHGLQNLYLPILKYALDHRVITLVAAAAIFVGSMALTPLLKTNLFDSSGQNTVAITQTMPPGTNLDTTVAATAKIETILKETKGVDTYQVTAGSTGSLFGAGGGTDASATQASFDITTDPDADKNTIVEDIRARVADLRNAGTVLVSGDASSSMSSMSQVEVRVSASDPDVLKQANDIVLKQLRTVDGLANVTSNLSEGRPSATVVIDQAKATTAGVSASALSQYMTLFLNGYSLGAVPTAAGVLPAKLTVAQVAVPPVRGAVSQTLMRLPVSGTRGTVPLGDIARVVEIKTPVQVTHVDGQRTASITASSTDNNIGAASTSATDALDEVQLPNGATWEMAGATQMTDEVFRSLGIAIVVAILLVYLIMVATFRSLLHPLILLISIPFAAVGVIVMLVITGTSLGMPSLIGALMLVGIVVTNAIVLLDLVEQFRRRGMDARTAIIEGGRRRLRPILMTAVATILALIPMALGFGGGSGFLSTPLAVVVIGGLVSSTFLTLILVPVLYLALDRLRPAGAYDQREEDFTVPEPLAVHG